MRALKATVIFMGILIVAGFAFVIVTIVGRVGGDSPTETLGAVTLDVDPACRLADAWSAEGLLYIRLSGAEGNNCEAILLVKPETGREVGRISLGQSGPLE